MNFQQRQSTTTTTTVLAAGHNSGVFTVPTTQQSDVIVIGSLLPNVNVHGYNGNGNNGGVVKLAIPLNNKSNYAKVASTTNINIPVKLPAASIQPIKSINLSSVSLLSANSLTSLTSLKSNQRW